MMFSYGIIDNQKVYLMESSKMQRDNWMYYFAVWLNRSVDTTEADSAPYHDFI